MQVGLNTGGIIYRNQSIVWTDDIHEKYISLHVIRRIIYIKTVGIEFNNSTGVKFILIFSRSDKSEEPPAREPALQSHFQQFFGIIIFRCQQPVFFLGIP